MIRWLRVVLPLLALLLLAAHFYRAGAWPVAVVAIALIALLGVGRPWAARVLQVALVAGTVDWLHTAWVLVSRRMDAGQPYARLLVILGAVAALTAAAAWVAGPRRPEGKD